MFCSDPSLEMVVVVGDEEPVIAALAVELLELVQLWLIGFLLLLLLFVLSDRNMSAFPVILCSVK